MIIEHSLQDLKDRVFAVAFFQLNQQSQHELADPLDMSRILFPLEMEHILSGMPLEVRRKGFTILGLVACIQHAMHPLQHFHQQLQPPYLANVAPHLAAIHALQASLQLESHNLLVGHLFECLIQ